MEYHFYAVVICKSSTCRIESAVKYLGRVTQVVPPYPRDQVFLYECPKCHKERPFKVGEVRVRSYGFDPPEDWIDQF